MNFEPFQDIVPPDHSKILLSILTPTMPSRKDFLIRLASKLVPQIEEHQDEVEWLFEVDDGNLPTGTKRNALMLKAHGPMDRSYLASCDDDDLVLSHDRRGGYVSLILDAIKSQPGVDVIGMTGLTTIDRDPQSQKRFIHSIQYSDWHIAHGVYLRCPNHLNPIRRELAMQVRFPDCHHGEDFQMSRSIRSLLKTEVMIREPIYLYEMRSVKHDVRHGVTVK